MKRLVRVAAFLAGLALSACFGGGAERVALPDSNPRIDVPQPGGWEAHKTFSGQWMLENQPGDIRERPKSPPHAGIAMIHIVVRRDDSTDEFTCESMEVTECDLLSIEGRQWGRFSGEESGWLLTFQATKVDRSLVVVRAFSAGEAAQSAVIRILDGIRVHG